MFKTVNGNLEVVGDRVDSLCQGYLEASFDFLLSSKVRVVCLSGPRPSSDYLASVFLTYVSGTPEAMKDSAVDVVRAAIARAFPCERVDPGPPGSDGSGGESKHD